MGLECAERMKDILGGDGLLEMVFSFESFLY